MTAEYLKVAADLSKMLLGQVAARLGNKRLVIVGEGSLQYVQFSALPIPAGATSARPSARFLPLIVEHEVESLPAVSVLTARREEWAARVPARKMVPVLADPVFRSDDPRIAEAARAKPSAEAKSEEPV